MGREHVLEASPHLLGIGRRHDGLRSRPRPSAQEHAAFILIGEDARGIGVLGERGPEVVPVDRQQRRADLRGIEKVAEASIIGRAMSYDPIDEAAIADLIL